MVNESAPDSKGQSRAGRVVLWVIGVVVALWWVVPTARKAYYDAEVRALCAKDGGIRVFETAALPPGRARDANELFVPLETNAKPTDNYFLKWKVTWIVRPTGRMDDLDVSRDYLGLVRRSDQKLLGESVSYLRRGGDPPGPWEPTFYRCPHAEATLELTHQVFAR